MRNALLCGRLSLCALHTVVAFRWESCVYGIVPGHSMLAAVMPSMRQIPV
jgi:hypothetical protein